MDSAVRVQRKHPEAETTNKTQSTFIVELH